MKQDKKRTGAFIQSLAPFRDCRLRLRYAGCGWQQATLCQLIAWLSIYCDACVLVRSLASGTLAYKLK